MHKVINILKDTPNIFNQWRLDNPDLKIDLSNADLSGLNLSGKYLMNINFRNANLNDTVCISTIFCSSNLEKASFMGANLSNTCFGSMTDFPITLMHSKLGYHLTSAANLRNVNFEEANLYLANCCECNMDGAILVDAKTEQANLSKAYWGGVILSAY